MTNDIFTFGYFKECVLKCLERFSSNGEANACGEMRDIEERIGNSLDTHLTLLNGEFSLYRCRRSFVFVPASLILKRAGGFLKLKESMSIPLEQEAQGVHIRFVGDIWVTLTLADGSTKSYQQFGKGVVMRDIYICDDGICNIVVSSESACQVEEINVFKMGDYYLRALAGEGYSAVQIPVAFKKILAVYDGQGRRVNESLFEISCEGDKIITRAENAGSYTIEYLESPPEFCGGSDSDEIRVPRQIFDVLCYMCAADLCPACEGELYSKLTHKYSEFLENYYDKARDMAQKRNTFFGVIRKRSPKGIRRG